jgi:hypothetical protein
MMTQKPSVISGVVHDAQGRPVEQARVYFTGGPVPLPEIAALTGSDGSFALTAPAPGTYQIQVATDTSATARAEVIVTEGEEARVKIKLKR